VEEGAGLGSVVGSEVVGGVAGVVVGDVFAGLQAAASTKLKNRMTTSNNLLTVAFETLGIILSMCITSLVYQ
jgi:hypothetical protein